MKDVYTGDVETEFDTMSWYKLMSMIFEGYEVDTTVTYEELPVVFNFKCTINHNDVVYRTVKNSGNFYVSWYKSYSEELDSAVYNKVDFLKHVNKGEFVII